LARIVAVADAFDAMTTDRPYKPKIGFREALNSIAKNSGTQFDPKVCDAFLKYKNEIEDIAKKHFKALPV
jgi:HD-GYP domain-containing protein (c-di-GMP phosphodiesterase class II)